MADEKKAKKAAKGAEKKSEKKSKKNPFKAIASFFKSVRSEGRKVVWPKAKEVFKNTLVVIVVILIVGVIIFGIDRGLAQIFKGLKNYAAERTTVAEETDGKTTDDALADLTEEDTTAATTDTAEDKAEDTSEDTTEAETTDAAD
jgi:preprotein translocase subunit SecE